MQISAILKRKRRFYDEKAQSEICRCIKTLFIIKECCLFAFYYFVFSYERSFFYPRET
jgi:hypothetical protein